MSSFAAANGLRLGEVYVEMPNDAPRQFSALVSAAQQQRALVMLVADVNHLGPLGGQEAVTRHLQTYTNARVMILPDAGP